MSIDDRTPTKVLTEGCASSTEWWYLGFLLILLFQPVFDPASGALSWISSIVAAAILVPFSLYVGRRPGRLRRWSPALSAALGLALFPINSGALVFLIYAAAFAAAHTPRTHAFRWFAGLSSLIAVLAVLTPLPLPFALVAFAMPALFVWVVGVSALEEVNRARVSEQLRIEHPDRAPGDRGRAGAHRP
jgi:two-component system sensor histidine kinase DesK